MKGIRTIVPDPLSPPIIINPSQSNKHHQLIIHNNMLLLQRCCKYGWNIPSLSTVWPITLRCGPPPFNWWTGHSKEEIGRRSSVDVRCSSSWPNRAKTISDHHLFVQTTEVSRLLFQKAVHASPALANAVLEREPCENSVVSTNVQHVNHASRMERDHF